VRDAQDTRQRRVFLMGEDVGRYGGCFAVSKGLLDEFGEERIRDTPLSESAFVGAGIGAALGGLRPIVEVMTVNFSLLALDQIVNTAATLCHMSGGQFPVPVVIHGHGLAALASSTAQPGRVVRTSPAFAWSPRRRWMPRPVVDGARRPDPVLIRACCAFSVTDDLPTSSSRSISTGRRSGASATT
jgi:hypothetical protein